MKKLERFRINPIEWMKKWGMATNHIAYDPKLRKGDYSIIRTSTHDGTLLFSYELIQEAFLPLATKASYHKPREKEFMTAKDVRYTVGPLRVAIVYGMVKLPCSTTQKYAGQRERVRIPVRMFCSSGKP